MDQPPEGNKRGSLNMSSGASLPDSELLGDYQQLVVLSTAPWDGGDGHMNKSTTVKACNEAALSSTVIHK